MFTEQVLPRLTKLGLLREGEAYVQLRTAGVGESMLETRFQPIFDRCEKQKVGIVAMKTQLKEDKADEIVVSTRNSLGTEVLRLAAPREVCVPVTAAPDPRGSC